MSSDPPARATSQARGANCRRRERHAAVRARASPFRGFERESRSAPSNARVEGICAGPISWRTPHFTEIAWLLFHERPATCSIPIRGRDACSCGGRTWPVNCLRMLQSRRLLGQGQHRRDPASLASSAVLSVSHRLPMLPGDLSVPRVQSPFRRSTLSVSPTGIEVNAHALRTKGIRSRVYRAGHEDWGHGRRRFRCRAVRARLAVPAGRGCLALHAGYHSFIVIGRDQTVERSDRVLVLSLLAPAPRRPRSRRQQVCRQPRAASTLCRSRLQ